MKRRSFVSLLLLGAMATLAGCGGGSDNDIDNPDQLDQQIIAAYERFVDAIETENIGALSFQVSPNYLERGFDRQAFLAGFQDIFNDFRDIEMTVNINDIEYLEHREGFLAFVNVDYQITGIDNVTGQRVIIDETTDLASEMVWRFEDSRWQLYGHPDTPTLQNPNPTTLQSSPKRGLLGIPAPKKLKK